MNTNAIVRTVLSFFADVGKIMFPTATQWLQPDRYRLSRMFPVRVALRLGPENIPALNATMTNASRIIGVEDHDFFEISGKWR